MESIFHVLIYFALRFLPHNADDMIVNRLLYSYFDDYYDGVSRFTCGLSKYHAITMGYVDITPATCGTTKCPTDEERKYLVFYLSKPTADKPQPALHPINDLIATFLEWFRAFYSLDIRAVEPEKAPGRTEPVKSRRQMSSVVVPKVATASATVKAPTHSVPRLVVRPPPEQEPEIRSRVETHDKMIEELNSALGPDRINDWPEDDKGADKRSPGGYVPLKEDTYVNSQSLSVKRDFESDDDEDDGNVSPSETASKTKRARRS